MTGTRSEANKHRGMKDLVPWYPETQSDSTGRADLPPTAREYPPAVPSERSRIAAPPTQPAPAHTSVIQVLFPVVGGVGMLGFALVYGNTRSCSSPGR